MPNPKKKQRVWVWLAPEELETLDDVAEIANLPPVRAEQIRFVIRMHACIGRILTDIERILTELKSTLAEERS